MPQPHQKRFRLQPEQIVPLLTGLGSCIASDQVTVEGKRVGLMYREVSDNSSDSGWRFLSGLESDSEANDSNKLALYDVNTIANYDPEILPHLDADVGSMFAREEASGRFVRVK